MVLIKSRHGRIFGIALAAVSLQSSAPVRVVPIPPPSSVEEQEQPLPSAHLPRVAILIDERIEDSKRTEGVSDLRVIEHELMADWTKRGFVFQQVEALGPSIDGGVAHIPDSVDVMIVGTALTRVHGGLGRSAMGPDGLQMISCQAVVGVRAFDAKTGKILASFDGSKSSLHLDATVCGLNALKRIAADASAELWKGVAARWMSPSTTQTPNTTADP